MITKDEITTILRTIIDPELGHNIVDLGLVYDIDIVSPTTAVITMTLTSPGCPLAEQFVQEIKTAVAAQAGWVNDQVIVRITFDPPWSREAISEDLRFQLGI